MRRNRFKPRRKIRKRKKVGRLGKIMRRSALMVTGLLGIVILSFTLMTGYDFVTQCRYFSATTIQVNGLNRLTESQVLEQASIHPGDNILSVNLALTRKRLMAHPWIADVDFRRQLPDGLVLNITEQVSLAVVDLGRKFVINTEGDIFKNANAADVQNLPVITGLTYADLNVSDHQVDPPFSAVLSVLQLGSQPNSVIPNPMLRELHVDREIGLTLFAFDQSLAIRMGYASYPAKYKVLAQVLTYLNDNPETLNADWIDLNNPERIVLNVKDELTQKTGKEI
jgi:cell division protein FtsQ